MLRAEKGQNSMLSLRKPDKDNPPSLKLRWTKKDKSKRTKVKKHEIENFHTRLEGLGKRTLCCLPDSYSDRNY